MFSALMIDRIECRSHWTSIFDIKRNRGGDMYVNFFKSLVSQRISKQENDIARYSASVEDLDTCSWKLVLSAGCLNLPPNPQLRVYGTIHFLIKN